MKRELNDIEIKQREMLNERSKNRKPLDDSPDVDLIPEPYEEDSKDK